MSDVDVYAFGLATDFRTRQFPAARRLFELCDELVRLQVEVLCWCGRPGLLNARVEGGVVAREGAQFVVGDTGRGDADRGHRRTSATRCCAAATTAPATSARPRTWPASCASCEHSC